MDLTSPHGRRVIGLTGFTLWLAPVALLAACTDATTAATAATSSDTEAATGAASGATTATPIKRVVVVFQENVPFDRYFGVYPHALNLPGEPRFVARPDTPTVNGLTDALLHANPNSANPRRLPRTQSSACGSNHGYTAEQLAEDHGLVDRFVEETGNRDPGCDQTLGIDYFDGNTVTALWNYAQNFALDDNSFGTTFGPSHIGVLNLVSGQTHGALATQPTDRILDGTMIGNVEPKFDDCPVSALAAEMTGKNIGDLLNAHHVSWGFFSDGFRPTDRLTDGTAICGKTATSKSGVTDTVYDSGNEGFQYYRSTANPHHLPPGSVAAIGHDDQANHQYDLEDFWAAARHGNLPAVAFLKAGGFEQGGGDDSDPLDEQAFLVDVTNRLQRLASWRDTAIIILYDDSDGSYDHVMPPIVNTSQTDADALTAPGQCGSRAPRLAGYQARCGYGPRLPFLVISPWARPNFVDHTLTDQSSVIRFIEDNWHLGRIGDGSFDELAGPITSMFDFSSPHARPLVLDRATGVPVDRDD
ncbi:MAG TPA: alkaline phosphatase family protein [Kofleriaceae bacterium]|jgi:phospholipase C|nr:alkaline phosphatase family protein [Kofleriaceae bacterium]